MFEIIAFDADDTLWHNESLYVEAQTKLKKLLSRYVNSQHVEEALFDTETSNLSYYGYGIKSFTLSMIETALKLTDGRIRAGDIQEIIGFAKEMLTSDVHLLPHVESTISRLSQSHPLMIITKGDLMDQESKLARSGIGAYFRCAEVLSEKVLESYQRLLAKHKINPERFIMVGNSLKSDILPVIALGGHAVYVPYNATWAHEIVEDTGAEPDRYHEIEHLGHLPALLERLTKPGAKPSKVSY